MPTYQRFEDLPAWQTAIELAERVDDLLEEIHKAISWSKRDQLERASLSVSNNIAEGFERGTTNELLYFLYIARGSAGEVRSMLRYFARRPNLSTFQSQISNLITTAESCSRQLRAWADSLQNSEIQGQRHLNNHSRKSWERQRRREQGEENFQNLLREHLPPGHPARPPEE